MGTRPWGMDGPSPACVAPLAVRGATSGGRFEPWDSSRGSAEEVVGVSDGQTSAQAPAAARTRVGRPLLSLALASMMDEVHAHAGGVYLLAADEPVLEMAVMAGLPRAFAAPWERVGLSAPIPVAEAVRERELVWVGGEEDMAARFPRIAVVLPYPFALAALPVATESTVYGAIFVTWPGSHPPELSVRDRDHLIAARPCRSPICSPGRRSAARPACSARWRRRAWCRGCRTGCARSI